jgi:hypothetical protein
VLYRTSTGTDVTATAEPQTNYFAGRVRRDLRGGQSVIGGMVTAMNRDLDTPLMEQSLLSGAYMGGLDFRHEWAQRTWSVNGFIAGSHVRGSRSAVAITQTLPWHYFGRPDAPHLDLDTMRTSLTGVSTQTQLSYRRGRHWRFSALAGTTTPGYDVNDVGFQYRADRIDAQISTTYIENRPGTFLRQWNVGGAIRNERNYDGEHVMDMFAVNGFFLHLNYWSLSFGSNYFLPSFDDRLTRGGPAADRPANFSTFVALSSDARKPVSADVDFSFDRNAAGGGQRTLGATVRARPASSVNFLVRPTLRFGNSKAQYLGVVTDANATATFGRRYLFSEIEQTTFAVETRLNVTLTPELSLQVYAQPFLSSADFLAPAQLAAPRTYDFLVYGRDVGTSTPAQGGAQVDPDGSGPAPSFFVRDRDFNLRSLRGNAVLRWEWRPGSTMYLAWQQNREHVGAVGDFDFSRDREALFSARPDNVLVFKVNYWLNP